jgi:hypothetical protein
MRCYTCFVTGAGFSAPAGLPVQSGLLQNIGSDRHEDIQKIFNCKAGDLNLNDIALEDVFTFLDKIINGNEYVADFDDDKCVASFDTASARKIAKDLISCFIKNFNEKLKLMKGKGKYEYFFNQLVKHKINGETNTIVTFNWDTIPDFYINSAYKERCVKGGVDYGCYDWDFDDKDNYVSSILRKASGYSTVKLVKLHGSINWAYAKENGALYVKEQAGPYPDGLIIDDKVLKRKEYEYICLTPTFIKDLNNLYTQQIWHNAAFDLRDAERIVFLGCSLPLADYEFRYLMLKTAVRNKKNKIRVILYPKLQKEEKCAIKKRFENLFVGNDIKFKELDVADFLVDKKLIWDW